MSEVDKRVRDYLEQATVFIIDRNAASRRRLAKVVAEMGASSININRFSELKDAEESLLEIRPDLVFCDFHVGQFSGLDFFQRVRDAYPNSLKNVYILVTSNVSQSAVAKAAEEDVDSYIIKPYTYKAIQQSLTDTILDKINPSDYHVLIEKGKELLFSKQFEEAMDIFEQAIDLHETPTLALYYHGQTKQFLEVFNDAEKSYQDGLSYNKIHFKCQIGLYDLFMAEKKFEHAYDVLVNIAHYFPPNAERLMNLIKLSVVTGKVEDIPSFYDTFLQLETKGVLVSRYMCAGLFVAGKSLLANKKISLAIDVFENVTISSAGETRFIWGVINTLVENNLPEHIYKFINRFSSEDLSSKEYRLAKYFSYYTLADPTKIIKEGLELFNENIKHFYAYKVFIEALIQAGQLDKVDIWIDEAISLWPEKKKLFHSLREEKNKAA